MRISTVNLKTLNFQFKKTVKSLYGNLYSRGKMELDLFPQAIDKMEK